MTVSINTRDLVAANLTVREALLASIIAEIHTIIEKAQSRPSHCPDGSISEEVAASILMMTAPVLDLVLGRKKHRPGDLSRIELIAKLAKMEVPVMPTYPDERDLDAYEDYSNKVEQLMLDHLAVVDKSLPIPGDLAASYRWADDVAENGYDQRGR